MPEERRQFRVLYRDFLRRIIDLDVLSATESHNFLSMPHL